ncbi:MAG: ATP-binding protein [Prolixibacteraceae bacterium]
MKRVMFFILLFCSFYSFGQNNFENFVSFSTSNGMLKHNSVESFTRDQLGYIWVGTNFGLYRLDGYQTICFNHDPKDEFTLSSNIIKALCTDSNDDIWIGTIGGGLNRYDRASHRFIRYLPFDTTNSETKFHYVRMKSKLHTLSNCYPIAEKKKIELIFPQSDEIKVYIDKNTILMVLRNLIANAIKFSSPGSQVELKVYDEEERVVVKVMDQSIGMTSKEITNLFKIETLTSKDGTSGETGTGLGLILCHEFLHLNNSEIWVESIKGAGSTFSFSLNKEHLI